MFLICCFVSCVCVCVCACVCVSQAREEVRDVWRAMDTAQRALGALGAQGFADDVARFLMPPVLAALQAAAKAKAATPGGGGR